MLRAHKRHLLGRHHPREEINTRHWRSVERHGTSWGADAGVSASAVLRPLLPAHFLHAPPSSLPSRKVAPGASAGSCPSQPGPQPRCLSLLPGRGGRNQQTERPPPRGQLLEAQGLPGSPCAPARAGGSPPGPRASGIPDALGGAGWSRCLDGPPPVHAGRRPECRSPRARAKQGTAEGAGPAAGWALGPQGCRPFPRSVLASADGPTGPGAPAVLTLPWFCTEKERQAEEGGQRGGGGRGPGCPGRPEPRVSACLHAGPPKRQRGGTRWDPCPGDGRRHMRRLRDPHGGERPWGPRAGTQGCRARLPSTVPVLVSVAAVAVGHLPPPPVSPLSTSAACPDAWNTGA